MTLTGAVALEFIAHDRPCRHVSGHDLETGASESGAIASERRTRRALRIDGIRLERRRLRAFGRFDGCLDQGRGYPLSAVPRPNIETGQRPYRSIVDSRQARSAFQPGQVAARRELTPTHRNVTGESEQTGRRSTLDALTKFLFVQLPIALVI